MLRALADRRTRKAPQKFFSYIVILMVGWMDLTTDWLTLVPNI
jgi:hypothetical protein